jgi:hypothetical protein
VPSFLFLFCKTHFYSRKHEEHLAKAHKEELDNIAADHLRETEEMLEEFNRAQEMLKDKISSFQME